MATVILVTMNSIYELDEAHSRVRRLKGVSSPTGRFSEDGVWRKYNSISFERFAGEVADSLVVHWDDVSPRHTFTSQIRTKYITAPPYNNIPEEISDYIFRHQKELEWQNHPEN